MNINRIQSIIITSLFLSSSCVLANNTNVEELQHKIKERDKVILELLQRVENLERRVGVSKRDPQKITPIEKDMSLNGEATIADSRQIPGKSHGPCPESQGEWPGERRIGDPGFGGCCLSGSWRG